MDVFEALGLDLPDNTRSMSVTEADPDLMSFLAPVFGWNEQEASANSLILFPHDSQQGFGGEGLLETPSVNGAKPNDQPGNSTTMGSQPTVPQADVKPEQAAAPVKVSPFSGISQFDLFLGDPLPPPAAPTEPTDPASAAGPSTAPMVSPFVQPAPAVPDVADMQLQSEFSQSLLGLLEEITDPTPQQEQQQQQLPADPPTASPLQQPPAMLQPPSSLLQQQPQQQGGLGTQQASTGAPAALPTMPQQQLVPPMLPPMMLRPPQQLLQQQQYGVLQQPQAVFQPLVSPLLLQAQQQQQGGPLAPLRLPQVGQQLPLPVVQLSQQLLQQRQLKQQQQQQQQQMPFQQQLLYQQQMQQQQQLPVDLHLPDADGSGDGEQDCPPGHLAQPKRRGRPPKVPGQYSKGYEAIKRYREKKKGMVEHMEAEIALKREQLHKLQAEQEALRSHQVALESTMSNQDKLLAQLLQLKLSLAGKEDSKDDTDLEATTAAAMAGVQQALAMQNGGDAAAAQAAAAAAAAAGRQRLVVQQQRAQQKVLQEGPLFLRRYQAYVQAVADTLAREAAAAAGASSSAYLDQAAIAATAAPFPTFPFTLIETLSLWQLSRLAIMTRTNVARHDEGGNTEVWDDFTLNLSSGQHDYVSQDYWKGVAGQIGLHGEQPQQLSAAWRLYANAMNALNEERQGLLLKLQAAAAAEDAADPAAAAGLHPQQQQQQQLPGASSSGAGFLQGNVAPAVPGMLPASAQLGQAAGSGCNNNNVLAAQASSPGAAVAAGAAAGGGGGSRVNRLYGTQALDVAFVYMDLLDAVERNLLRGRAVIMMFGWSMLCMLSAEQIGRICVASWPYFPLMRAIVGYMLGKEDLVP